MHILVIRFSALGDVAMLAPVVHALAAQHPEARITVVSRPFAKAIFENLAPNVNFLGINIKDYHGLAGLNRLYSTIAALEPTHIADCHGVLRTHFLRFRFHLSNALRRITFRKPLYKIALINKHRKEKRQLTAPDNKVFRQLPTSFQNYADVLRQLGLLEGALFSFNPSPFSFCEGASLRQLPSQIGEKKPFQTWVGIAPFATHKGKIYPLDQMEKVVATLLHNHPNWRIFLFHGKGKEAELMAEWEKKYNVLSASTLLGGMDKELILMSHLNVMLSMDSSNMHLASLVGCPVVSVWGATHRYAGFLGWNQKPENCVELDLPCRPCSVYGNRPCLHGDYRCLTRITPEMIISQIEELVIRN